MIPAFGENYRFQWEDLGDIELGRPNLGPQLRCSCTDWLNTPCGKRSPNATATTRRGTFCAKPAGSQAASSA